ncbi:rho guanine nucleotide exchange factor 1 isoform X2 [Denticeps clupeoides]|uniref:rho guanine nucleotide exchange factor 1 isoform X2 n=1 Tax=Denticeps clupeoides TaxID=299321 RepID=UPI0010A35101|nr:rho guanine nucleotide exchange factor 1 isoform X2 [Denticeps clupeoides]
MSIIGAEDEDFENDLDPTVDDRCSIFSNIEQVKTRPTHLLVFLHHVLLQFDCAPVLCYLHADLFKSLNAKEAKKNFADFCNTFLDKGAILRVPVPQYMSYELDRTRPDLIPEDQQRRFVNDIQYKLAQEVARQLEDFKQKRMMGMTPNENELVEVENHYNTDRVPREMKEKAVAEMLLDKMSEIQSSVVSDDDKWSSIFGAVVSYMKHLGVKTRAGDTKKSGRGFFKKKNYGKSQEIKPKQRGFTNILDPGRWIGGGNIENKTAKLDYEGEKTSAQERKGSINPAPSRTPDPAPPPFQNRKTGSISAGSSVVSETTEMSSINISISNVTTDSSHSESGQATSRTDNLFVFEGGDSSPISLPPSLPILDPAMSNEIVEDSVDKDRAVRRSESLCVVDRRHSRRSGSTRGKSRSRSDVDLQAASSATHSPTPSPQPRPFIEIGPVPPDSLAVPTIGPSPQLEEIEPRLLELEQDPPNWRDLASSQVLSSLSKKEIKRQEVINELFATEHAHVRMLTVLQMIFSRPIEREGLMTSTEVAAIFPSLDDIIDSHYSFYEGLKKLRQDDSFIVKSIATTLINRFSGSEGEWFQKISGRFCSYQSWALDQIKSRQKKDARFNTFIQEAESKPQCRRLQLKDIIPIEMQRLTKYPLLLENISKSTENDSERESIQQAAECCRKILNHVNEEVKDMENLLTLKEYQRKLDTSGLKPSTELYTEYKNFDLTTRMMQYEGPLTWRVTKEKALDVQCVLLGDLLVLLQKQDDKMTLKCQSKSNLVQEGKQMLSPIIKLESAFLREVATDRKAFYVIFTWESGAQIYELVAHSVGERKIWTDMIKSAVDSLKTSGVKQRRIGSINSGINIPNSASILHPPLSPTENGGDPLKSSTDRDKDSLVDEKSEAESTPSLMTYLSANGFDPIEHSSAPSEKIANNLLDETMNLKRLLVGNISLSDHFHPEGKNGGLGTEGNDQEPEQCQTPVEGDPALAEQVEEEEEAAKHDEGEKVQEQREISTPLVLSHEQKEEVLKRLQSIEDKLKKLQNIEEDHHRLQEILAKFSLQGSNYH